MLGSHSLHLSQFDLARRGEEIVTEVLRFSTADATTVSPKRFRFAVRLYHRKGDMMASPETNTMREELRLLVDHIPEGDVPVARKILRALMDPVELALLNAPEDDEPLSEHELAALEEADRRERSGEPLITHDEIMREFGPSGQER